MYPHTSQSTSPRGFRRIDATLLHRFPTISQLFLTKNNCTVHDNVSVRQFYIRFIRLTSPRAGDPFGGLYRYYRYSLVPVANYVGYVRRFICSHHFFYVARLRPLQYRYVVLSLLYRWVPVRCGKLFTAVLAKKLV